MLYASTPAAVCVHCRTGSLESAEQTGYCVREVHCRTGSLESSYAHAPTDTLLFTAVQAA